MPASSALKTGRDFHDRMEAAFSDLRKQGIVSKAYFLCCLHCATETMEEIIFSMVEHGVAQDSINGFCFFTDPDGIDMAEGRPFNLYYGSLDTDRYGRVGKDPKEVGQLVFDVLGRHGIRCQWSGDATVSILVYASTFQLQGDADGEATV